MFWAAEIIISTKKITLIDYQKKKNYPNIGSINHCKFYYYFFLVYVFLVFWIVPILHL